MRTRPAQEITRCDLFLLSLIGHRRTMVPSTEEEHMRTHGFRMILVLAIVATGCSSSTEPMAVEFSHPQGPPDAPLPFTASGMAVEESAVCPGGTQAIVRLEAMDGTGITDEDWADMFDGAMEAGSVAEMMVQEEWTCADGSGAFTLAVHTRFDFATFEFEGQQDVGTWEISGGTSSLSELTGSGTAILDWENGARTLTGEVLAG
jgi:hypothetical protein